MSNKSDHIGGANKMASMLREIVDMWDGPRYALQMKPLIDRARKLLADHSPDAGKVVQGDIIERLRDISVMVANGQCGPDVDRHIHDVIATLSTPAADGGKVGPVGWIWDAYGQRNFTAGTHHKNVLEADGLTLIPVYTHPAESREEIPVSYYAISSEDEDLFEPDGDGLDSAMEKLAELEARHPETSWDLIAVIDAARLRASQQEGGE